MTDQRTGTILTEEHRADILKGAIKAGFKLDVGKIFAPSNMPINRELERLIVYLARVKK